MDYKQETEGFENETVDKIFAEELVHSLPSDEMAVLTLKVSDEYKTEEIAKILGISVGTLWDTYRKAIAALRRMVEKNT